MQLKAAHGVKSSDKYHMTELTYARPPDHLVYLCTLGFHQIEALLPNTLDPHKLLYFLFLQFFGIFNFWISAAANNGWAPPCSLSALHFSPKFGLRIFLSNFSSHLPQYIVGKVCLLNTGQIFHSHWKGFSEVFNVKNKCIIGREVRNWLRNKIFYLTKSRSNKDFWGRLFDNCRVSCFNSVSCVNWFHLHQYWRMGTFVWVTLWCGMSEKAADSGTRYSREQIHFQQSFQKCAIWLHLSRFRCWSSRAAHFGRKMNWRSTLHILFLQGREFDGQSGQKRIFITIWQFKSSQMRNFHKMVLFSLATAAATGIINSKSCCHFLNFIFLLCETALLEHACPAAAVFQILKISIASTEFASLFFFPLVVNFSECCLLSSS